MSEFCVNRSVLGFMRLCIISRWSFTRFCILQVDDMSSLLVP